MPTYDYRCTKCGEKLEAFQKITDPALKTCPKCGADALQRGPGGGIGLSFKGTGWYKTDYAPTEEPKSTQDVKPPESSSKPECCPCGKNQGSCSS